MATRNQKTAKAATKSARSKNAKRSSECGKTSSSTKCCK